MTICIAACTNDNEHLVVVSDRRLSSGDIIAAADDATLKMREICKGWGAVFAADDASLFLPLIQNAAARLPRTEGLTKEELIIDAFTNAYREIFDRQFTAKRLYPFGYSDISDFKKRGATELGSEKFEDLLDEIGKFDLGITVLVFGFDFATKRPRIYEFTNPGVCTDHNLMKHAVIGSGFWMATAALRRKPPGASLESTVYRLLEAKFSSETASGVGKSTSLLTMSRDGTATFAPRPLIVSVRDIWTNTLRQPDPSKAIKKIKETPFRKPAKRKTPKQEAVAEADAEAEVKTDAKAEAKAAGDDE